MATRFNSSRFCRSSVDTVGNSAERARSRCACAWRNDDWSSITPRLKCTPRSMASCSVRSTGVADNVPVGTLPRNGFCCCPASVLGVLLLVAGLIVRGDAMLPTSTDDSACCAAATADKPKLNNKVIMIRCTVKLLDWLISMSRCFDAVKFLDQESQRHADKRDDRQQSEAIQKSQHGGILCGQSGCQSISLLCGVGRTGSHAGEIPRGGINYLAEARIVRCDVLGQNAVMKLRAALQHGSDKRHAKTSSQIAEEVGNAGSLIVFVERYVGIGQLADRYKEKSQTHALHHTGQRVDAIVRVQIERSEIPHGQADDDRSKANQPGDANFWREPDHDWGQHHNHQRAWSEDQSGVCSRVAKKRLQHLRYQHRAAKQREAENEI